MRGCGLGLQGAQLLLQHQSDAAATIWPLVPHHVEVHHSSYTCGRKICLVIHMYSLKFDIGAALNTFLAISLQVSKVCVLKIPHLAVYIGVLMGQLPPASGLRPGVPNMGPCLGLAGVLPASVLSTSLCSGSTLLQQRCHYAGMYIVRASSTWRVSSASPVLKCTERSVQLGIYNSWNAAAGSACDQVLAEKVAPEIQWGPALLKHRKASVLPGVIVPMESLARTAHWVATGRSQPPTCQLQLTAAPLPKSAKLMFVSKCSKSACDFWLLKNLSNAIVQTFAHTKLHVNTSVATKLHAVSLLTLNSCSVQFWLFFWGSSCSVTARFCSQSLEDERPLLLLWVCSYSHPDATTFSGQTSGIFHTISSLSVSPPLEQTTQTTTSSSEYTYSSGRELTRKRSSRTRLVTSMPLGHEHRKRKPRVTFTVAG